MDIIIAKTSKQLKIIYIIQLCLLIGIIIFNFIIISKIYWLQKILKNIYQIGVYIYIINIILPIISLIFLFKNKIIKKNVKIFKALTMVFSIIAILFGLFFSAVLMINAIESPEFCKECPFILPSSEIISFNQNNLNKKCNERRCALNSQNPGKMEKNEEDMYEYLCNYNPTDEFELVQDSQDIKNNNNNTATRKKDNIFCVELTQDDIINNSELKNYLVINFYNFCNSNTNFYLCERSQAPDEFELEENFVCPEKDYITKLVIFCMLDVLFNLIFGFFPWKSEYNKYKVLVSCYEPRRGTNVKTYSFSSTLNSSKIPKDKDDDKFEHSPTEMIIVYGNHNNNNNIVNNINGNSIYNNNVNINSNDNKKNDKKINFSKVDESSNNKQKNKTEIKLNKNINVINNINIINNNRNSNFIENETEINLNKENSEQKKNEDEHRVTISYNIDITSAEKITLAGNKSIRKDI